MAWEDKELSQDATEMTVSCIDGRKDRYRPSTRKRSRGKRAPLGSGASFRPMVPSDCTNKVGKAHCRGLHGSAVELALRRSRRSCSSEGNL